jgi:nucleoid-associated protein YgaU
MPEPVVIIGPAGGPAGPIGETANNADGETAAGTGTKDAKWKSAMSTIGPMLAQFGAGLFGLLARALGAVGAVCMVIVRRYPRHSLAAGASVLILGAIWYSEVGRRGPLSNQIGGKKAAAAAKDTNTAANSAAPDAGAVKPTEIASKDPADQAAKKPDESATAPPASGPANEKATPAPTLAANDDPAPTLPSSSQPSPADLAPPDTAEPAPSLASSVDQSAPTLLASALPDHAAASPPGALPDDKPPTEANKPAPAMEPPAVIGALAPAPAPPTEVAPAPPAGGEPVQLTTNVDEPNKSTPSPAPAGTAATSAPGQHPTGTTPQPATPVSEPPHTDTKPKDTTKPKDAATAPEPKSAQNPTDSSKSDSIKSDSDAPSAPSLAAPEVPKNDAAKPVLPAPAPAKTAEPAHATIEEPAHSNLAAPDEHKSSPAVTPTTEPSLTAGADKPQPPAESPPARLESPASATTAAAPSTAVGLTPAALPAATAAALVDSHLSGSDSKSHAPEAKPLEPVKKEPEPENGVPQATLQTAGTEPQGSSAAPDQPKEQPRAAQNPELEGLVSIPNSGKIVLDEPADADAQRGAASSEVAATSAATRDIRAHTSRNVEFEPESPGAAASQETEHGGGQTAVASGAPRDSRSTPAAGRVEPNSHVVEPNENFWTISRLYYSSGRYYRALWKANVATCPKIDRLKVNDVIVVPAVEDLDPAYIDPPRTAAPASLGTARRSGGRSSAGGNAADPDPAQSAAPSADTSGGEPISTARTNRTAEDGIPVRRSSRTDPDLDLPAPDAVSLRDNDPDRTGRRVHRPLGDDDDASDDPQTRTAARPRAGTGGSAKHPVYRIRPNETLRSIARDMLGDSHRASEILDLNRDVIDDPSHLIVGQLLQLPDDARTSVRRSASR